MAYIEDKRKGDLQGGKGINGWGEKVSKVSGFALRYKEKRWKVGRRSLSIFQGCSKCYNLLIFVLIDGHLENVDIMISDIYKNLGLM